MVSGRNPDGRRAGVTVGEAAEGALRAGSAGAVGSSSSVSVPVGR